jgi:hypothetical protein
MLSGMAIITGNDIQDMVRHWLNTPVCGYLGSGYGQDIKAMLQRVLDSGDAQAFLEKMRMDIPILQTLPDGALNLYAVTTAPDKTDIVIDVAGNPITI